MVWVTFQDFDAESLVYNARLYCREVWLSMPDFGAVVWHAMQEFDAQVWLTTYDFL